MQRNKRLRERTWAYIEDDVSSVVEETIALCGDGVSAADVAAAAAKLATRAASLGDELSSRSTDEETRDTVRAAQRRVTLCHTAARRCLQRSRDAAALQPSSADAATQTAEAAAAAAAAATVPATGAVGPAKRARLDDAVFREPEAAPSPVASPVVAPSSPAAPPVFQAPPAPAVVTSALSLSEGDMVRIAADLVFAIMRAAQASSYQIRSLGELFIECDKNGDGGISFVELLQWVKNDLKVAVTDWQLDEFGKHMGWREICKAHPLGHIDQKGFYGVVRSVWRKVKWYFSNAVVYGVSKRDTQKRRHAEVLNIMDELRDPLQRLIHFLVVRSCHIHQFFASFDAERTQQIRASDLTKVFAMMGEALGISSSEEAETLAYKCCLLANYLAKKGDEDGGTTRRGGGSPSPPPEAGMSREATFHYAAMCALSENKLDKALSVLTEPADSSDMVDSPGDLKMRRIATVSTQQGIATTLTSLSISLYQLQDLVLEFFSEFTLRMDLNVLAEESRDKLIFRHLYFAVCGVFEAQTELQPVANIFTLFAKYAERDTGHLHPYGFQQLLKRELCISVTEHEIVAILRLTGADKHMNLKSLSDLLNMTHAEIGTKVKKRFPATYVPSHAYWTEGDGKAKLTEDVIATFAKLILKVLHTEESFADFFKELPRLRPADVTFAAAAGVTRYPDEIVVGLRRLGIIASPSLFEGLGQRGEGWSAVRWAPAPAYMKLQHFLDLVWVVYSNHIVPAFGFAVDFRRETQDVAAKGRDALCRHLGKTDPSTVPHAEKIRLIWDALPKDAAGASAQRLVSLAGEAYRQAGEKVEARRTLACPSILKTLQDVDGCIEAGIQQILHVEGVTTHITREQLTRLFSV